MFSLTDEQWKLYNELQNAITNRGNVADLLERVSKDDLKVVLTDASKDYETVEECKGYTLTLLGSVIHDSNQKNIEAILEAAIKQGILNEVLTSLEKDDHEKIQTILQNSSIIDEVSKVLDSIPVKDEDAPQPQAEANTLNLEKVQDLLNKGADINQTDKMGFTLLCVAARSGCFDTVQALLNKGANVDIQTNSGYTALCIAARNGRLKIVQALLNKGANVDIQTSNDGYTALYIAARDDHLEIVQALLNKGAHVNKQTNEALLEVKGIDVDARKVVGHTPLYLAAQNDRIETMKALLKAGANHLLKDEHGKTPIDLIHRKDTKAELQKLIEDLKTQDTTKSSVTKPGQDSNTVHQVEDSMSANKPIIIGSVCGVIAALAVSVGCFATGVALPMLAIASIVVAAAVLVGLVAGGITYAVSSKLEETNTQGQDPFSQKV
ncbi:MAG: ankyrin repeat domain-containing protein [Rickettsiales bacterium]|jgi:ankyrin repeat protein|nr:ankyrin repeat domain-containing protein [Rickettsiales bacterium]MDR1261532.1 ankyrin repeat domain-containing protein [Rickettsiales bacterium]